jgi:hypothetical protein
MGRLWRGRIAFHVYSICWLSLCLPPLLGICKLPGAC